MLGADSRIARVVFKVAITEQAIGATCGRAWYEAVFREGIAATVEQG
ncbi:MAG: hypothetical protein V3U76_18405 [Granulosicoccus sp.]